MSKSSSAVRRQLGEEARGRGFSALLRSKALKNSLTGHSEESAWADDAESLFSQGIRTREILRFAQNDNQRYFFSTLL
jgi:hypothetical protein